MPRRKAYVDLASAGSAVVVLSIASLASELPESELDEQATSGAAFPTRATPPITRTRYIRRVSKPSRFLDDAQSTSEPASAGASRPPLWVRLPSAVRHPRLRRADRATPLRTRARSMRCMEARTAIRVPRASKRIEVRRGYPGRLTGRAPTGVRASLLRTWSPVTAQHAPAFDGSLSNVEHQEERMARALRMIFSRWEATSAMRRS